MNEIVRKEKWLSILTLELAALEDFRNKIIESENKILIEIFRSHSKDHDKISELKQKIFDLERNILTPDELLLEKIESDV